MADGRPLPKATKLLRAFELAILARYHYTKPDSGYRSVASFSGGPESTGWKIVQNIPEDDPEVPAADRQLGLTKMQVAPTI